MDDIESYLIHVKNDFLRRASISFLQYLAVFAVSFIVSYAMSRLVDNDGTYMILAPVLRGNASLSIKTALISQIPLGVQLALLFVSVFTLLNKWIIGALSAWRGICLGAGINLMMGGNIKGLDSSISFAVYFIATIAFLILSAVSSVYSTAITHTYSSNARRYTLFLAVEYIKYFLVISGGIFVLGYITVILI